MRRRTTPIEELRLAVDVLPPRTQEAMLRGIRESPIVVGAYTDRDGGVCPMLAAHRRGGRTDLISFARAWDRFAGAKRARRATRRELAVLEATLEAGLLRRAGDPDGIGATADLGAAIAEHQAVARRRRADEARQADAPVPSWLRERRARRDAMGALEQMQARGGVPSSLAADDDAQRPLERV